MQKLIMVVLGFALFAATASPARAQAKSYQLFTLHTGVTGAYGPDYGRAGFGGMFEAKLNIHDNIAVGARLDGQVMFGGNIAPDGEDVSVSLGVVASQLLKGEYLATTSSIRPFVGFGLGLYTIASQDVSAGNSTTSVDQVAGRFFGIAPSLGINLGIVRLAATYNMILGADIEVRQRVGMPDEKRTTYSQSYFTFELSFRIGGKKKPPPPTPLPAGGYYNPTGPYRPPVTPAPAPTPAP